MKEICIGCGATIQTTHPKEPGYIHPKVYEARKDDFYCERCYVLQHYNKNIPFPSDPLAFQESMKEVKQGRGLVVLMTSLFDLEGTLIPNIHQWVGKKDVLVVVNKFDLMMKSVNKNKVHQSIRKLIKASGINAIDVLVISSFYENDVKTFIDVMNTMRKGKNVYFIGMTNVGKSTLVNQIIHHYTQEEALITVSNTINTTLGNIHIPLDDESNLVDTPGCMNDESIIQYLSKEHLEVITPNRFIRPKTYQLNSLQTLFVQGIIRIDFLEGTKFSAITYFKNDLLIHRTKLENATEFYLEHQDDLLKIPDAEERLQLGSLIHLDRIIHENEKIDVVIPGLGFLTIAGAGQIRVHTFRKIKVKFREALL
ncbi:MAG: ribosome biogenesis GTPase YqeH [Bacilli bacterium]|nr:ribosome biogenesis GTPase YqeH [Bacilli bacterium]